MEHTNIDNRFTYKLNFSGVPELTGDISELMDMSLQCNQDTCIFIEGDLVEQREEHDENICI